MYLKSVFLSGCQAKGSEYHWFLMFSLFDTAPDWFAHDKKYQINYSEYDLINKENQLIRDINECETFTLF